MVPVHQFLSAQRVILSPQPPPFMRKCPLLETPKRGEVREQKKILPPFQLLTPINIV
jgi:hypothetical protein